jgi:hypothetical protein
VTVFMAVRCRTLIICCSQGLLKAEVNLVSVESLQALVLVARAEMQAGRANGKPIAGTSSEWHKHTHKLH